MKLTPNSLGKHFFVGLEGTSLSNEEKEHLSIIRPSGIIIFSRNFAPRSNWRKDLKSLFSEIKTYSNDSVKFFSIDFEGGRVNRFPEDIKRYPYAQEWGENVFDTASEMAKILHDLNFNLTYGPVADIDLNLDNPVIGKRAFSNNKDVVAKYALEFMRANSTYKILTCAKHFPGHGRTSLDSHFELPEVSCSKSELETDLYPFQELIKAKIPFVMSAHVNYPCFDPNSPASLSKKIQTDLLRKALGFKGLIISDDMDMKALKNFSGAEKSQIALKAGTDFLLFGNGMDGKSLKTVNDIIEDLIKSDLDSDFSDALSESGKRIDSFKGF